MRIGLVRHLRLKQALPRQRLIAQSDLLEWFDEGREVEVELADVELGDAGWQKCYVSDLPRARQTAEHIFAGEIEPTDQLREVELFPLFNRDVRLPLLAWAVLSKLAFTVGHRSQRESQAGLARRVEAFLDEVLNEKEDVLLVSHSLTLMALKQALQQRGFAGPNFKTPLNGVLYVYQKPLESTHGSGG